MAIKFKEGTSIEEMLNVKPLDRLLADGDILDCEAAARKTGYSAMHLRRMCRDQLVDHIERGAYYFFYPWQVRALFKECKARAKA